MKNRTLKNYAFLVVKKNQPEELIQEVYYFLIQKIQKFSSECPTGELHSFTIP